MTEKAHAIAYWLLPEPATRRVFAETIAELGGKFRAPIFDPHVTVFVGPENSRDPVEVLGQLGEVNIALTIHDIRFSEQFTKTLFVQFERSDALQKLGDRIWKETAAPERYIIDPHLSLLYAEVPLKTKQEMANQLESPFQEVRFNSICAMRCASPTKTPREVEQWKLLASQQWTPRLL